MRLHLLNVEHAASCGGLLDGLQISFDRPHEVDNQPLTPICLLGPNGSGKSQFLQLIAEIFQSAWHIHAPKEEREASNTEALFELQYFIRPPSQREPILVRLKRSTSARPRGTIEMAISADAGWQTVSAESKLYGELLPSLVVGYTSGDNETLSLPFLVSRSGYADDVGRAALKSASARTSVADNHLLLVDYGTHLEVLVANLLLGTAEVRAAILEHAGLDRLASCRCVIQLNHSVAPKMPGRSTRKGIQLTAELEDYIDALQRSATCWSYENKPETYVFDYFVTSATFDAFSCFFTSAIRLYRAFHKLSLLNDLAIPKRTRERVKREARDRRFASRLPEPQDEDKVFRFEQVRLNRKGPEASTGAVDYVSLSDGEHQQAEIYGVFSMIDTDNVLFVLDEPESHFNPQWRVQFVKRLMELPTENRSAQEVILTSHAPFVPSDMSREQVLIFSKIDGKAEVKRPDIETYGATFDRILEHCFNVRPPISQLARDEIERLMTSGTVDELRQAMDRLGSSVDKAFLADRLRQLTKHES
jgi:restriction system-associated AAA family ATPase